MARYRRHSNYYGRRSGYDDAKEHIRQAQVLSVELGGTDKEVKEYFFSLDSLKLDKLLVQYESKYGAQAREYAQETMPNWRSGQVQMSGMVAERIYDLLPPTMPVRVKHRLAESLWEHVGPRSSITYYIGPGVDINEVASVVKTHLQAEVIDYVIPDSIERRFDWLSQGDIELKQQLLNHFRQQNRLLLDTALREKLPVILNHINSDSGRLTTSAAEILQVGKHIVRIEVSQYADGITDVQPYPPESFFERFGWIIVLVIIILYFYLS